VVQGLVVQGLVVQGLVVEGLVVEGLVVQGLADLPLQRLNVDESGPIVAEGDAPGSHILSRCGSCIHIQLKQVESRYEV